MIREDHFRETHLLPTLKAGFIEITLSSIPGSSKREYRLTKKGQAIV